jgi:hypothetical protein
MTTVGRTSVLLLFGLGFAAMATAEDIPSPWWQSRMNDSFKDRVRVSGPVGSFVLRDPQVDSTGIRFAGFETAQAWYADQSMSKTQPRPVPPATIPWSEIDRVETPKRATGFGALVGGALGAALAVGIAASGGFDQETEMASVGPALCIGGGAVTGAAFGAGMTRWHVYYPPR